MPNAQHFQLPRMMWWLYLLSPLATGGMTIFMVSLPFTAATSKACGDNSTALAWVAVIGGLLCGLSTWAQLIPQQRVTRAAISVDEDGLWVSRDGKAAGLVPWCEVTQARERSTWRRLDLLDDTGRVRLSMHWLLTDFPQLRSLVIARAALKPVPWPENGLVRRSWRKRLLTPVGMLILAALWGYVHDEEPLTAIGGGLFFMVAGAWFFFTTPLLMRLQPDSLEVTWPLRRAVINRADILDIAVEEDPLAPAGFAHVVVRQTAPHPPIVLRKLGLQPIDLGVALRAWRTQAS